MHIDPARWEELVSGRRRGWRATLARGGLALLELPYGVAVGWRNRAYDRQPARIQRAAVPVISVGNLTTGGTGKTPLVAWVARYLRHQGLRVVLVSRGYGAQQGATNDEALELEHKLPDVPHVQNPDRVAAVQMAVDEFFSQVALLDDGFQHRRLHRDLDIVLIDALEPFGYGHLLPRGLLRESLSGLRRAHAIGLSRADSIDPDRRAEVRRIAQQYAPDSTWFEMEHQPQELLDAAGRSYPLSELDGMRCLAFCGIGNPAGFRHTLAHCRCELLDLRSFPDHFAYARQHIDQLEHWVKSHPSCERVLCTHKDLVKVCLPQLAGVPLRAVVIAPRFLSGQDPFERRLQSVVAQAPRDA